eukprot:TRINITY_DN113327_c0_g1_i1.p2 TRINITY_DN113327_c0_g1~~TRINITY_DN113327_c0_g1_i1.p2  ORF type:complete len:117 (-),score=10.18 TRINITY_DN113327_c0_g1_i1:113-421(-)
MARSASKLLVASLALLVLCWSSRDAQANVLPAQVKLTATSLDCRPRTSLGGAARTSMQGWDAWATGGMPSSTWSFHPIFVYLAVYAACGLTAAIVSAGIVQP